MCIDIYVNFKFVIMLCINMPVIVEAKMWYSAAHLPNVKFYFRTVYE